MVFDPNFAIYSPQRTEIPILQGRIDGYFAEEHQLTLGTTENPIESGSTLTDNAVKRRERLRLEGMVSDLLPAPGLAFSPDRPADAWNEIVQLFKDRTLVTVITAIRVYRNMMIVRAVAPRTVHTGQSLRFTLDLQEMLFSETDIARFTPTSVDPNGPAADRTTEVDSGDVGSPIVAASSLPQSLSTIPLTTA